MMGFFAVYVVCFCCVIFLFRPLYSMFTFGVTFPEGHLQCVFIRNKGELFLDCETLVLL